MSSPQGEQDSITSQSQQYSDPLTVRGTISDYKVERVGLSRNRVVLHIIPEYAKEPVHLSVTGKPNEVCSLLNGIPFKGDIQLYHLKNAPCTLSYSGGSLSFVRLGW